MKHWRSILYVQLSLRDMFGRNQPEECSNYKRGKIVNGGYRRMAATSRTGETSRKQLLVFKTCFDAVLSREMESAEGRFT